MREILGIIFRVDSSSVFFHPLITSFSKVRFLWGNKDIFIEILFNSFSADKDIEYGRGISAVHPLKLEAEKTETLLSLKQSMAKFSP